MASSRSTTENFWGSQPEAEYYASMGVRNTKEFVTTPYGRLFTQSWLPSPSSSTGKTTFPESPSPQLKGLVFCTHGYGSDTSWLFQKLCIAVAQWGYGVYAADVLGHGQSEGLQAYIADVESTSAASLHLFKKIRDRPENKTLKKFLFGESMGGGLTFLMMLQDPSGWDGAILSAPLLVMPPNMTPSPLRLALYSLLFGLAETWPSMPQGNVAGYVFRDKEKGKLALANPRRYRGRARVGTMRQLVRMCEIFKRRCHEVSMPFLVMHGTCDDITAFEGSQELYERAASADKTIKLYEGFYHSLIQAELDENADLVLSDMRAWLDART